MRARCRSSANPRALGTQGGQVAKNRIGVLASLLWLIILPPVALFTDQKQDYLTDDEVEQLREAQDPAERIKLLDDFLKARLQRAKALKSPESASVAENKSDSGKDKNSSRAAKKAPPAGTSSAPQKTPQKSFNELMGEYLQCLDEISSNVENFSSFRIEPKTYLKSLKGLEQSLQEHKKWLAEISGKLDRSEKETVADVSEALEELSADVNTGIQKANDELKALKESKKAKNDRQ